MKKIIFISLFGFISIIVFGQVKPSFTPNTFVRCHTTESEVLLKEKFPKRATTDEFESWLAPKIAQIKADRAAGRNIQVVYNIPVVIHIVHNGDAIGAGENITDAQAMSQITVMNQDFRRMTSTPGGANTTGLAVDCEINFCIAQTDPNGLLTTGIIRHNIAPYNDNVANGTGGVDWETNADVQAMKTATQWNPTNYLNMWTIRPGGNPITAGGLDGLLGYAQFPDASGLSGLNNVNETASTDGVVAGYNAFGTIAQNNGTFMLNSTYNLGRTMTHEVGHWLGLRHIWGDDTFCPATNTNLDKDFCADTPAARTPNYTCDLSANTCASNPGNDQVQNYMDYTNDSCMDTFTADQKLRMVTVMMNSPRRGSLNVSTTCQTPTPIIRFQNTTGSVNENTNCSFTDFTYPINIGKAPTQNATVTFNVSGASTATNSTDFTILNPNVTFPAGSITTQNLTLRIFHDGLNEASENIIVNLSLNANGGDAVLNSGASTITIGIADNDPAPLATQQVILFNETFDPVQANASTITDLDGDGNNWGFGASGGATTTIGFTGSVAFSRSWISPSTALTPDNLLTFNNAIVMPTSGILELSFAVGTTQAAPYHPESYAVYLTTSNVPATIIAQTPVYNSTLVGGSRRDVYTVNVSALAGQTLYLSFRHYNTVDMNWILLDDIAIKRIISADVQTAVNTGSPYIATINAAGTAYAKDEISSKMIADLISTNAFNYGCTNVSVSRDQATAGASAVNYGSNTANNLKVMAKVMNIAPANNNPTGTGSLKFYFSESEIVNWETATGNLRSTLRIIKAGNPTFTASTLGTFGNNTTLSGPTNNGLGGVYYFGTENVLSTSDFEINNSFRVYPNPTNGVLNIEIVDGFDSKTNYTIYNNIGQVIKEAKIISANDLKINTSNLNNGVYFIKIIKSELSKTVKFIKD